MSDLRGLDDLVKKVRPFTMVHRASLVDLAEQICAVLDYQIPGNIVECGVWRGGAAFLAADLLRQANATDRKVWLFDSFEGLPPPEPIDGTAAMAVANAPAKYYDNCTASLEDVQQTADRLGVASYVQIQKGWFDQTLPASKTQIGKIAVLRVDGDWYSSVRCCLENLVDQVVDGGFVILDDYYSWDGCATAVHEFLGLRKLPHRLESVAGDTNEAHVAAVFRKNAISWRRMRSLWLAGRDICSVVPAGGKLILVDADQLREALVAPGRQLIPCTERDGHYNGAPADDQAAIDEFNRLARTGTTHAVFAWPAFWWLEYYSALRLYLESQHRRVLCNERVIVFELSST